MSVYRSGRSSGELGALAAPIGALGELGARDREGDQLVGVQLPQIVWLQELLWQVSWGPQWLPHVHCR